MAIETGTGNRKPVAGEQAITPSPLAPPPAFPVPGF